MNRTIGFIGVVLSSAASCLPRGDLDSAAQGSAPGGVSDSVAGSGNAGAGGAASSASAGAGSSGQSGATFSTEKAATAASAGMEGGTSPHPAIASAGDGSGGATGEQPTTLKDLPIDLAGSPVEGELSFTGDAVWEVDGAYEATFEVRTPTANYWLVKSLAALVSITDTATTDARQWIGYSSFRPLRGVPSYGSQGLSPKFTTVLDPDSQSPHHVRLRSENETGDLRIVWDFYLTHVTLSVEAAPSSFSFSYRGAPAGSLAPGDSLLTGDGATASAFSAWLADFPGKPEWVALVDPTLNRALFVVQHADDDLADRYQVKDNDSALVLFGRGPASLPARFSLGLVDRADFSSVQARVQFVDGAMR